MSPERTSVSVMATKPEGAAAAAVGEAVAVDVPVTFALAAGVGVDTFVGATVTGRPPPHAAVTIKRTTSGSAT